MLPIPNGRAVLPIQNGILCCKPSDISITSTFFQLTEVWITLKQAADLCLALRLTSEDYRFRLTTASGLLLRIPFGANETVFLG
ncbi:hypothetical protein NDU88_000228 [Pleurodeles waltl]|uniref:Uncharacterized protein n=1 Tax=Pleurodeles waltl TaxID=8319 RepID=A0AAV7TEC9_PLEWA|nr:hypothetical protein NDU88_000228 [Pleurodeles waltl]